MSVEDVSVIVNIKTLKGRLITHKFNTGWEVGVVEELECIVTQFVTQTEHL